MIARSPRSPSLIAPEGVEEDHVQVGVRVRPLIKGERHIVWRWDGNSLESEEIDWSKVTETEDLLRLPDDRKTRFKFERVYRPENSNRDIYEDLVQPLVHKVVEGYNATVLAYGQTTSGKTHTISGDGTDDGLLQMAVQDLFQLIENSKLSYRFSIKASYCEIYGEVIYDLLDTSRHHLSIAEDPLWGPAVKDLSQHSVESLSDVLTLLKQGNRHRRTGETDLSMHSSRSHAIFSIRVESKPLIDFDAVHFVTTVSTADRVSGRETEEAIERDTKAALQRWSNDDKNPLAVSSLNMIDLAGSERVSKTRAKGVRLKEAGHINKSLSALGNVISSINEKATHIPFRNSKLTRLLTAAFGGNSNTAMVCCISPALVHLDESRSTLQFAKRSSHISTHARVNRIETGEDSILNAFKLQVARLEKELALNVSEKDTLHAQIQQLEIRLKESLARTLRTPHFPRKRATNASRLLKNNESSLRDTPSLIVVETTPEALQQHIVVLEQELEHKREQLLEAATHLDRAEQRLLELLAREDQPELTTLTDGVRDKLQSTLEAQEEFRLRISAEANNDSVVHRKRELEEQIEELNGVIDQQTHALRQVQALYMTCKQERDALESQLEAIHKSQEEKEQSHVHVVQELQGELKEMQQLSLRLTQAQERYEVERKSRAKLEQEVEDLRVSLEETKAMLEKRDEEAACAVRKHVEETEERIAETSALQEQCRSLQSTNTSLHTQVEELNVKVQVAERSLQAQTERSESLEAELIKARQDHSVLLCGMEQLKDQNSNLESLNGELQAAQQELKEQVHHLSTSELQSRLETESDKKRLQEENTVLTKKIEAFNTLVEEWKCKAEAAEKDLRDLRTALEAKEEEAIHNEQGAREELHRELKFLRDNMDLERAELQAKIETESARAASYLEDLEGSRAEVARLKDKLATESLESAGKLQDEKARSSEWKLELEASRQEVLRLRESYLALKTETSGRLQSEKAQVESLQLTVKRLEDALQSEKVGQRERESDLEAQLEALRIELNRHRDQQQEERRLLAKAEARILLFEEEREQVASEQKRSEQQVVRIQESCSKQVRELLTKLQQRHEELESKSALCRVSKGLLLLHDFASSRQSQQTQQLQLRLAWLQMRRIHSPPEKETSIAVGSSDLRAALEARETELAHACEEKSEWKRRWSEEMARAQRSDQQLKERERVFEEQLSQRDTELGQLEMELEETKAELKRLEQEKAQVESDMEMELEEMKAELKRLEQEKAQVESDMEMELEEIKAELKRLEQEKAQVESDLSVEASFERQYRQSRQDLQEANERCESLRRKVNELETSCSLMYQANGDLEAKHQKLQHRIEEVHRLAKERLSMFLEASGLQLATTEEEGPDMLASTREYEIVKSALRKRHTLMSKQSAEIEALNDSLRALQKSFFQKEKTFEDKQRVLERSLRHKEKQLAEKTGECESLQDALEALREKEDHLERVLLRHKAAKEVLQKKVQKRDASLAELTRRLSLIEEKSAFLAKRQVQGETKGVEEYERQGEEEEDVLEMDEQAWHTPKMGVGRSVLEELRQSAAKRIQSLKEGNKELKAAFEEKEKQLNLAVSLFEETENDFRTLLSLVEKYISKNDDYAEKLIQVKANMERLLDWQRKRKEERRRKKESKELIALMDQN